MVNTSIMGEGDAIILKILTTRAKTRSRKNLYFNIFFFSEVVGKI